MTMSDLIKKALKVSSGNIPSVKGIAGIPHIHGYRGSKKISVLDYPNPNTKLRQHFAAGGNPTCLVTCDPNNQTSGPSGVNAVTINPIGGLTNPTDLTKGTGIAIPTTANPNNYGQFVNSLYKADFNRAADTGGSNYWAQQLQSGAATPQQVAQAFAASQESQSMKSAGETPSTFINPTDFSKLDLASMGITDPTMAGISNLGPSPVTPADTTGAGTSDTTPATDGSLTTTGNPLSPSDYQNFLTSLYQQDLGRAADVGGQQYWLNQLQTGALTPDQVAANFASSSEAGNYDTTSINNMITNLTGGQLGSADTQALVNQIQSGNMSLSDVASYLGQTAQGAQGYWNSYNGVNLDTSAPTNTVGPNDFASGTNVSGNVSNASIIDPSITALPASVKSNIADMGNLGFSPSAISSLLSGQGYNIPANAIQSSMFGLISSPATPAASTGSSSSEGTPSTGGSLSTTGTPISTGTYTNPTTNVSTGVPNASMIDASIQSLPSNAQQAIVDMSSYGYSPSTISTVLSSQGYNIPANAIQSSLYGLVTQSGNNLITANDFAGNIAYQKGLGQTTSGIPTDPASQNIVPLSQPTTMVDEPTTPNVIPNVMQPQQTLPAINISGKPAAIVDQPASPSGIPNVMQPETPAPAPSLIDQISAGIKNITQPVTNTIQNTGQQVVDAIQGNGQAAPSSADYGYQGFMDTLNSGLKSAGNNIGAKIDAVQNAIQVPLTAAQQAALGLIATNESGGNYNVILGDPTTPNGAAQGDIAKSVGYTGNLENMTLSQINAMQTKMLKSPANNKNSSAIGAYQFTQQNLFGSKGKPGQLAQLGITPDMYDSIKFTPALQEKLAANTAIEKRGMNLSNPSSWGKGAKQEWTSVGKSLAAPGAIQKVRAAGSGPSQTVGGQPAQAYKPIVPVNAPIVPSTVTNDPNAAADALKNINTTAGNQIIQQTQGSTAQTGLPTSNVSGSDAQGTLESLPSVNSGSISTDPNAGAPSDQGAALSGDGSQMVASTSTVQVPVQVQVPKTITVPGQMKTFTGPDGNSISYQEPATTKTVMTTQTQMQSKDVTTQVPAWQKEGFQSQADYQAAVDNGNTSASQYYASPEYAQAQQEQLNAQAQSEGFSSYAEKQAANGQSPADYYAQQNGYANAAAENAAIESVQEADSGEYGGSGRDIGNRGGRMTKNKLQKKALKISDELTRSEKGGGGPTISPYGFVTPDRSKKNPILEHNRLHPKSYEQQKAEAEELAKRKPVDQWYEPWSEKEDRGMAIYPEDYQKGNLGLGRYAMKKGGTIEDACGGAYSGPANTGTTISGTLTGVSGQGAGQSYSWKRGGRVNDKTDTLKKPNLGRTDTMHDDIKHALRLALGRKHYANGGSGTCNASSSNSFTPFLDNLYQQDLGRAADQGGEEYWANQMANGMSPEQVAASFYNSQEAQNRRQNNPQMPTQTLGLGQAAYNNLPPSMQAQAQSCQPNPAQPAMQLMGGGCSTPQGFYGNRGMDGNRNNNFINNLYQQDLGRAPDQSGGQYWLQQIQSGAMTPQQVAQNFANSSEAKSYQQANPNNQQFQFPSGRNNFGGYGNGTKGGYSMPSQPVGGVGQPPNIDPALLQQMRGQMQGALGQNQGSNGTKSGYGMPQQPYTGQGNGLKNGYNPSQPTNVPAMGTGQPIGGGGATPQGYAQANNIPYPQPNAQTTPLNAPAALGFARGGKVKQRKHKNAKSKALSVANKFTGRE